MAATEATLTVLHSFPVWLPQTQTWMYNQVRYLPRTVRPHVVCERTLNLDQFAVPDMHVLRDEGPLRAYREAVCRRLHIRLRRGFLVDIASRAGASLVHSHFGHIGWANTLTSATAGCKQIVTFYGMDVNRLPTQDRRWLTRYRTLFAEAHAFLCEGPHMARELVRLGCPVDKVVVHHLGIETDLIPFRPRHWHRGDRLRVLIAASFRQKKGIPYAIAALGRLKEEVPLEITLIGDADAGAQSQEEKRRIVRAIGDAGLQNQTELLGFRPYREMLERSYEHHVFISPSITAEDGDTEGGAPVTLTEMMASGMPVVSTTHCDIPEVVQYGIPQWLVEERDVDGLAERLQWLLQHAEDWGALLRRGRTHVEDGYDVRVQGERLAAIYQQLVGVQQSGERQTD